jgi:hypothetical protein
MTTTPRDTLLANLANLNAGDQRFAASLLGARNPSEKQSFWIAKLAERATAPAPAPRATTAIGSLTGIKALFDKARQHLRHPAIVLNVESVGPVKLSVAGAKARVPGSINVATNAPYGESTWFGRILEDGNFEASPREATPPTLTAKLSAFACEPAKVAAEHGKLTGSCCFCNRALTDARSTTVGYGPVCADNFGLAWGE